MSPQRVADDDRGRFVHIEPEQAAGPLPGKPDNEFAV
jgi:hypothetical protein